MGEMCRIGREYTSRSPFSVWLSYLAWVEEPTSLGAFNIMLEPETHAILLNSCLDRTTTCRDALDEFEM
jgi:hypothetical protein